VGNTVHDVLSAGISISGGSVTVQGNHIYRLTGAPGDGVALEAVAEPARVEGNWIHEVAGSCIRIGRAETLVGRNMLYRCGGDGLSVGSGALVTATNNLVYACRSGAGVAVMDGSEAHIVHHTVVSNSYGIRVYGESMATVLNSILWDNLESVEGDDTSAVTVTYSDVSLSGTLQVGEGNINDDPRFRAPERGDYRLREDSPCIDRGTPVGAAGEDIRGISRPHGERYDMGAYEFFEYFSCYMPLVMRSYQGGE